MGKGVGFARLTVDSSAIKRPVNVYGFIVLASVAGGDATAYNGQDANSGRKFATLKGSANVSNPIIFHRPVYFENGIFVDIGSNITEVTVIYETVDDDDHPVEKMGQGY